MCIQPVSSYEVEYGYWQFHDSQEHVGRYRVHTENQAHVLAKTINRMAEEYRGNKIAQTNHSICEMESILDQMDLHQDLLAEKFMESDGFFLWATPFLVERTPLI